MASKWIWIVAVLLLTGLVIFFMTPPADHRQTMQRTDLPWLVTVEPDGSSRVFDLHIGTSTLQDAIVKFGNPEAVALYLRESGTRDLETYFGTVSMGPLKAKIILNLLVDGKRLDEFEANAIKQEFSAEGDKKLLLDSEYQHYVRKPVGFVSVSSGFIGGALVRYFHDQGFSRIRGVDKKPLYEWYQRIPAAESLCLDLSEWDNCRRACEGAAEVYNLAADMGGMGFIHSAKCETMRNNIFISPIVQQQYTYTKNTP